MRWEVLLLNGGLACMCMIGGITGVAIAYGVNRRLPSTVPYRCAWLVSGSGIILLVVGLVSALIATALNHIAVGIQPGLTLLIGVGFALACAGIVVLGLWFRLVQKAARENDG